MAETRVERRLAAIFAADVAGYSRLMGADEVGTLSALKTHRREVVDHAIAQHHGRIVKTTGDGMLVEFASAVDAVTCAVEVQRKMAQRAAEGNGPRIQFRVGINIGDIIIDGDDIFGEGVNIAARVENECEPPAFPRSFSVFLAFMRILFRRVWLRIPGIPGEHAPGSYIVDWDARTLTASYATQPLEPAPGGDPEIIPDNNPPA